MTKQATKTATIDAKPAAPTRKPDGSVAQCWALFDSIAGGELVPRAMAVDLAVASGINQFTARTQFQRWFTARKAA